MIKRIERADGPRWQVYAKRDGRKAYVGTFDSARAAREADEDHRVTSRKIERGELPAALDLARDLETSINVWLDGLQKSGARRHRAYSEFTRTMIVPRIGKARVASLTTEQIEAWRDDCATRYAPRTVNSALGCLSSACKAFVKAKWMAANPCKGVSGIEVKERAYEWIKTIPEIERLLRNCDDEIRDIVAVAVGAGLRIDEILHLAWDDIDLSARLITVQRGRQGTPKGGMRYVPIFDSLLPVLQARALRRGGNVLVFPSRTGKVRAKAHVWKPYKAAVARAGLSPKLRFHDLRHTMASHFVASGGDIFRLSKLLGHKSVLVTERTYAHLAPTAWQLDYHRLAFRVPTESAKIYSFPRDPKTGRVTGRVVAGGDVGGDAEIQAEKAL